MHNIFYLHYLGDTICTPSFDLVHDKYDQNKFTYRDKDRNIKKNRLKFQNMCCTYEETWNQYFNNKTELLRIQKTKQKKQQNVDPKEVTSSILNSVRHWNFVSDKKPTTTETCTKI